MTRITNGFFLTVFFLVLIGDARSQNRVRIEPDEAAPSRLISRGPASLSFDELAVETFNTFLPAGWSKITNFGGSGWQQGEVDSLVPGFDEGVFDAPSGGGEFIAFASWATGDSDGDFGSGQPMDQWLITPRINGIQTGDSLKFYLKYFNQFGDNLDVLVSDTGNDTLAAFDSLIVSFAFSSTSSNEWQRHAFALTDFAAPGDSIYIAFRERVASSRVQGDALFLDLVEVSGLVTEVNRRASIPRDFALHQNYPNPFNPTTQISFSLPQRSKVTLRIYNLIGNPVATIIAGESYSAGTHRVSFDASGLANGIYYYQIRAGEFVGVRKMTVVK